MSGKAYSSAELEIIKAHYPDTNYIRERLPHRSLDSISVKAGKLGVTKPVVPQWTFDEHRVLRRLYPDFVAIRALLPSRTRQAIATKAGRLHLGRSGRRWSPERIALLAALTKKLSNAESAKILGGTTRSIADARSRFDLSGPRASSKTASIPLVQDIFDAARAKGIILGKITTALKCERIKRSHTARKLNLTSVARVVRAMDGEFYAVWDD